MDKLNKFADEFRCTPPPPKTNCNFGNDLLIFINKLLLRIEDLEKRIEKIEQNGLKDIIYGKK